MRARAGRRSATTPESVLWRSIRAGALGAKARRQMPIGPYILDFAFVAARVAVEIDGELHARPQAIQNDAARTAWLKSRGWTVLSFTNAEVMGNLEGVLRTIAAALGRHPLPKGEGEVAHPA